MKRITENLALFSVVALALGLYRLVLFYNCFGIDIVSYIEVTEVLQVQFFPLLGIIMIVVLVGLFIMVLLTSEIKFSEPDSIGRYLQQYDNFGLYKIGSIILGLLMLLFVISGHFSSKEGQGMLKGKALRKVVLIMDKDSIKTNQNLIYVGKTRNYVFLYNREILQSRVLKMEDIKEIKIYRIIEKR